MEEKNNGLNDFVGKKCLVRTYAAGVWFGKVQKKSGSEIILKNGRRLWRWWADKSISLSAVAAYGIKQDKSKIAVPVTAWLEAIEIIPCSKKAIKSIEGAEIAKVE